MECTHLFNFACTAVYLYHYAKWACAHLKSSLPASLLLCAVASQNLSQKNQKPLSCLRRAAVPLVLGHRALVSTLLVPSRRSEHLLLQSIPPSWPPWTTSQSVRIAWRLDLLLSRNLIKRTRTATSTWINQQWQHRPTYPYRYRNRPPYARQGPPWPRHLRSQEVWQTTTLSGLFLCHLAYVTGLLEVSSYNLMICCLSQCRTPLMNL